MRRYLGFIRNVEGGEEHSVRGEPHSSHTGFGQVTEERLCDQGNGQCASMRPHLWSSEQV